MDGPGHTLTTPEDVPACPVGELCDQASLCVLASSSKGNCTVLVLGRGDARRLVLIDAGLSPRRTGELLEGLGVQDLPIHAVVLTHLDNDHWHRGWLGALPDSASVFIHRRHRGRAQRCGILYLRTEVFEAEFFLTPGVRVLPELVSHDDLGAAAFRLEFDHSGRSLGFATDLGRATQKLVDHLRGVDVLAIESNYCTNMQSLSARPWFLKRRIMNGSGHLSNEQAAEAVRAIAPREHLVLLHLSLDCNTPEAAAMHHAGGPWGLTISNWDRPTPWIPLTWPAAPPRASQRPLADQPLLW
jgi:phosphoribosyl 1,2-cyclic phosphodiesterase